MKIKRRKYKLNSCKPSDWKKRRIINKLDFEVNFPYYPQSSSIDLRLLRRFLRKNKIPIHYLYSLEEVKEHIEEREKFYEKQKQFFPENEVKDKVYNRFDLMDL